MNIPNLPDHLRNRARGTALDDVGAGLGTSVPPYVSLKGNRFTLIDAAGTKIPVQTFDPQMGAVIDVVIVAGNKNTSRIYYAKDWDPSAIEFQPPDCWSDNGVAPSVNASSPQHPTCAGCPMSEWGSDVSKATGRGIPACSQYKKLAVVFADPDVAGDMVFLIRVPPNSIKPLRSYVQQIAKMQVQGRQLDTTDLITRIYFDVGPNGNQLGTLGFRALDFIDPDTLEVVDKVLGEPASLDLLLGRNDRPRQAALTAPAAAPAVALPPQQFQPQPGGPPGVMPQGQQGWTAPPVAFPGAFGAPPQQAPAQAAQPGGEPAAAPRKRGAGRPRKNAQQAPQQAPQQATAPVMTSPPQQAPFQPPPPAQQQAQPAPQQLAQPGGAPFQPPPPAQPPMQPAQPRGGIVNAPPPDAAITTQLNALFGR